MKKPRPVKFVDLKKQYAVIGRQAGIAAGKVMLSGSYILGEQVRGFEKEFAGYCGTRFGAGVASGTEALCLALKACGVGPGDEVITVANAGVPPVVAIEMAGGIPVFADVDPGTCLMDASKLGKRISRRTKAVLPVHLYGRCADMRGIMGIARRKGLRVVEDACQAHGALYKGKKAGAIGDAGCFSFYPTKNLGCFGDGGMVVTSDSSIDRKVRMLRDYGQSARYVHEFRGINSRLDELQAAILRVKLKRLDAWNRKRAELAGIYAAMLENGYVRKPEAADKGSHVYHLYVVKCPHRDMLRGHLRMNGIETLVHYPVPVYMQKAYSDLRKGNRCPASEKLCDTVLSLPLYPEIDTGDIERVCRAINRFRP
ncbi:MAG: DegT/DnrJ/EryC1/StrS family aminotransferase [Candidatus Omnitrophica bacterium]|nr:DegT/DnrJ/EryC1/StrS family aminotransferase [Candidatus Omnitrophota bacterium]